MEPMMARGFKLTDQDGWTRKGYSNACQWGPGITHKAEGKGKVLCSEDCIHDYKSPVHAVLFNPIGANFPDPILWEGKGEGLKADDGTKRGWAKYITFRQVLLPNIPLEKKAEFAIRIAKKVYSDSAWNTWADKWLSGEDRTRAPAWAAEDAAWAAAGAARAAGPQLIDETIKEVFGE